MRLLGVLAGLLSVGVSLSEDAVQELLLTPPEEISAVDCSDDEFFACYATSVSADVETYLSAYQDSVSEEEVELIRRETESFIAAARRAYDASLAWAGCDSRQNDNYAHAYRNMLRTRLLHDLHLLHATGSPWCSGLNTDMLRTPPALPQTEQLLVDNLGGSTAADTALAQQLLELHFSQIEARRRMLRQVLADFGSAAFLFKSDTPAEASQTDTASFDTAEAAWDTYLTGLRRMHYPLISHRTGGSGTPAQVAVAHALLLMSQEERLDNLSALRAKPFPSQHLTDFSKLEMTEAEKEEQQFELIKNSKYTPEQKLALYAKATGVEKLLRTPVEMRDPQFNEQAWSDDEFFVHYTAAIREDMEKFISEELNADHYLKRYGKEQQEADVAHCRQLVDKLSAAARAAHRASMNWFENELLISGHMYNGSVEVRHLFRIILQNRLLGDLFLMGHNAANLWAGSISENGYQGSCLTDILSGDFVEAVAGRDCISTQGYAITQYHKKEFQLENLTKYRRFILCDIYQDDAMPPEQVEYEEPEEEAPLIPEQEKRMCLSEKLAQAFAGLFRKTPDATEQEKYQPLEAEPHYQKAAELFREAERAWIAYIKVLNNINYPVDNSLFSGSGTGGFIHEFAANAIQSHNSFLLDIISFAGGGIIPSVKTIDFTQYEETEEAAEIINQIPG